MPVSNRRWAAGLATLTGALLLADPASGTASADVTVTPSTAVQGAYTKLTFLVPNESESASTVKLRVSFPTTTPLASVRVKRQEGWTADVVKTKLRSPNDPCDCAVTPTVTSITWTADRAAAVGPGEFAEFDVFVGPLPTKSTLAFPAVQSYDDGQVDRWTTRARSGVQPANPVPMLTLVPAPAGAAAGVAGQPAGADAPTTTQASWNGTARWVGMAGLAVGLVAVLAAGLMALRRRTS